MTGRASEHNGSAASGLIAERKGEPIAYAVLGMHLHLEPLDPADEERLELACARIDQELGSTLRHTYCSFLGETLRFDSTDFEYISTAASRLNQPLAGDTEAEQLVAAQLGKLALDDLQILFKGGIDPEVVDPTTVSFWLEIAAVEAKASHYRAYPVLSFTVPLDFELERFRELCVDVGASLRVRWGNAGLTYASWELFDGQSAPNARRAHARRFHGFDTGEYTRCVEAYYRRIRSVSWLTFLGDSMLLESPSHCRDRLVDSGAVKITRRDPLTVIQAGPQPMHGDVNRRQTPEAYREVDIMLREVRASDAVDQVWSGHWTDDEIASWLRRFE